jgi:DTW domain-containing protein YfiP
MCRYFQKIDTKTKFVVLMHPKEFKKVKNNTGYFTHRSLPNSELFVGIDFTQHARVNEIIATHQSYILFPSQEALNLTNTQPKVNTQPLAIFLIDATWACTKSIFYHSANLQKLPHMSFTTTRTSEYKIKQQPHEAYLSTMESTLVVLELLAQYKIEDIEKGKLQQFLLPFQKMVAYQEELIANPKSHAVRFKKHTKEKNDI